MGFIRFPSDPQPVRGDAKVSELVKIVYTEGSVQDHQDDINAVLLVMRELTTYTIVIRGIQTHVLKVTGPNLDQYSVIRYTVIGESDAPVV